MILSLLQSIFARVLFSLQHRVDHRLETDSVGTAGSSSIDLI
ncbi:hypothetical protein Pse7367_0188 [Thalassoporum mexicanum PCC 7367]|nr:hypothetical protein Pse7367_0188 [Pseudanabaena sp. PCC 7367]